MDKFESCSKCNLHSFVRIIIIPSIVYLKNTEIEFRSGINFYIQFFFILCLRKMKADLNKTSWKLDVIIILLDPAYVAARLTLLHATNKYIYIISKRSPIFLQKFSKNCGIIKWKLVLYFFLAYLSYYVQVKS